MKPDCTHPNLPAPDAACGPEPAGQQGAAPLQGASDALEQQLQEHQVELHAKAEALHDIERELKESRDRYISLFEHAPTAYLLLDEKGRISELNLPAAALLGQDRRKLLHRRFSQFLHGDAADTWHRFLHNDLQHADRQTCELKLRRSGGDAFWARLGGHRHLEKEGKRVLRIALEDISERKLLEQALQEKERYQRALLDNFPFMVWLKDTEGRFLAVNSAFVKSFGGDRAEEFVGKTDFDLVPAALAEAYRATDREVLASRRQIMLEEETYNKGKSAWSETYKAPVLDQHGNLLGTVGFAREITARKEAETALLHKNEVLEEEVAERTAEVGASALALSESERFFRATIDALPSALCVLNETASIVAVNREWRVFAAANGGDPGEVSEGANYLAVCDASARRMRGSALAVANGIRDVLAGRRKSFVLEYECSTPTQERWFEVRISRFADDGPVRLVVVHENITRRKELATAQLEASQRLKRLAAHLESVREEQNTRIAREVHDELGGTLTMLKLGLVTMIDKLTSVSPTATQLQGMVQQVDAALQTVKRISTHLRPAMLDALGLLATIRWHADRFSRMTGIEVELKLPDHVRLSAGASTAVFRIVQEGLTNVAKHSGAKKVSITMIKRKGNLILRMRDDGKGLPKDSLRKHDSFGLIGMRERAQHLGGELTLTGTPRTGTRLMLRLPLDAGATTAIQEED
ncbi:MAG TPA: PAS domain S-box protein [Rhodocyclaceae bacterium]|nr:PAS domain S-box protein [Rhodocyclaceae bacterium]